MSLARVALVRLGGSSLFLSDHVMVSMKLSIRDKDWKAYGIFDASKSYDNIGVRGSWSSAPTSILAFVKRGRHNFLELD